MTRAAYELAYEKASAALGQILDTQARAAVGDCIDALKKAYGPSQGELLKKRMFITLHECLETGGGSTLTVQNLCKDIISHATSQNPKWDAGKIYEIIEKKHNQYFSDEPAPPKHNYLPDLNADAPTI